MALIWLIGNGYSTSAAAISNKKAPPKHLRLSWRSASCACNLIFARTCIVRPFCMVSNPLSTKNAYLLATVADFKAHVMLVVFADSFPPQFERVGRQSEGRTGDEPRTIRPIDGLTDISSGRSINTRTTQATYGRMTPWEF